MTRYTDAIFFGFLFILDALAWLIIWASGSLPAAPPEQLAPMTVSIFVVIAAPALASVAILALVRALIGASPRRFWSWLSGAGALFVVFTVLALLLTQQIGLQVGFTTLVWFTVVVTLCALVALVLALVGAIAPAKQAATLPEPSPEPAPEASAAPHPDETDAAPTEETVTEVAVSEVIPSYNQEATE